MKQEPLTFKNYQEIGFLSPIYNAGLTKSIISKEGNYFYTLQKFFHLLQSNFRCKYEEKHNLFKSSYFYILL